MPSFWKQDNWTCPLFRVRIRVKHPGKFRRTHPDGGEDRVELVSWPTSQLSRLIRTRVTGLANPSMVVGVVEVLWTKTCRISMTQGSNKMSRKCRSKVLVWSWVWSAHAFNPSTWEAQGDGSLILRPPRSKSEFKDIQASVVQETIRNIKLICM